jgi:hypothetical protein
MIPEPNDMEDLFRSAFENATLEPPHKEEMWDKITLALQKPPVPMYRTKWFKVSSIAATVALLLGAYFLNTSDLPSDENGNMFITQEQKIKNETPIDPSLENKGIIADKKKEENTNALSKQEDKSQTATKQELKEITAILKKENSPIDKNSIGSVEKKQSQVFISQNTENKEDTQDKFLTNASIQTKKENNFFLLRFEVKELALLVPDEILSPLVIKQQPVIQLVIVETPISEEEKAIVASNYWIGFGGFYNAYNPNFSFPTSELPSALISSSSGIASINYGRGTNVAQQLRESLSVESTFSTSIDFGKTLSKYVFVRSGLGFTNTRYVVDARVTNTLNDIDVTDPSITSDKQSPAIYHDNFIRNSTSVMNIPIQIGLQTNGKKLNLFLASGLSTDITLNHSLSNTFKDASYNFGNYKAVNFSALGSAGLLYNFTPHFSTVFEVNYRQSITSVYNSDNLQSRPQWIGIGIGIRKKF